MKKFMVLLTAMCLLLVGCGSKKPVATELVGNLYPDTKLESYTTDMVFELSVSGQDGYSGSMNLSYTASKSSEGVQYLDGVVTLSIYGESISMPVKYYKDKDGTVYSYDSDKDLWFMEESLDIDPTSITALDASTITDLGEVVEDGEFYTVTGKASMTDMMNNIGVNDALSLFMGLPENVSDIIFDVKLTFAQDTRMLRNITYTLNYPFTEDGGTIEKFSVMQAINNINQVSVSVPMDIIENAKDPNSYEVGREDNWKDTEESAFDTIKDDEGSDIGVVGYDGRVETDDEAEAVAAANAAWANVVANDYFYVEDYKDNFLNCAYGTPYAITDYRKYAVSPELMGTEPVVYPLGNSDTFSVVMFNKQVMDLDWHAIEDIRYCMSKKLGFDIGYRYADLVRFAFMYTSDQVKSSWDSFADEDIEGFALLYKAGYIDDGICIDAGMDMDVLMQIVEKF